ncbi:MAG TPA: ABC transporter substrate-binding protein [Stellaceae bacterium]|jgi:NitT/TauT family transport system substrate-binding protein|nr:ABC transporter substrate-binding protein [Stellaceae bacterium]
MKPPHITLAAVTTAALLSLSSIALAATKITVGDVPGGNTLFLPSYVAMDRGFFKKEGLDASWVRLVGKNLGNAALAGKVDFVPINTVAALAALHGAPVLYVAGQSLSSQWTIVSAKSIGKPEDLKGKTVAYGQPGGANYDEGARVLSRFFHMEPGKDYKVISFQRQPDEVAALINGDVQAALLTPAAMVTAEKAGFKVLIRTGQFLPRLGGTLWTLKPYADQHPDTVKAFIRAIAEAIMYIRTNKDGTMPVIKTYLNIEDPQEQGLLWQELHDLYEATIPENLFRDTFEARRNEMISLGQWAKDKPLPDLHQFLASKLLDESLKEVHYVSVETKPAH